MHKVAKSIIIDHNGNHLLLYRNNHPIFGDDPDLPGGTLEPGEQLIETMVREVFEESGIRVVARNAQRIFRGAQYSSHNTEYSLFIVTLNHQPDVKLSWEHSGYEWVGREVLMDKAKHSDDTYMHMVYDTMKKLLAA